MPFLLSVLLLLCAPILGGLALAWVQVLIYWLIRRLRSGAGQPRPVFLILFLRGMIAVVALGAILGIVQTISNGKPI